MPNRILASDEDDMHGGVFARRDQGTLDDLVRRVIAAHRVKSDPASWQCRTLGLQDVLDRNDFASLVVPAFRADAVWLLRLVTLRARRERLRLEEVVRAARAGA